MRCYLGQAFWGADGGSGRAFPTQTGQRSGELTANCNCGTAQKSLYHLACLSLRLHRVKILNIVPLCLRFLPCTPGGISSAIWQSDFWAVPRDSGKPSSLSFRKQWISPPLSTPMNRLLRGRPARNRLCIGWGTAWGSCGWRGTFT